MPTYELSLIVRKMARPLLVDALKRAGGYVYNNEGYIRKVESLGDRRLPNIKFVNGEKHTEGSYVLMECDLKAGNVETILDNLSRDKDIIQKAVFSKEEEQVVCPETFNTELLSPADRPSIQALVEEGRRPPKFKKIFDPKTGLDYYPFHR
jgi:ribosomal protein S6